MKKYYQLFISFSLVLTLTSASYLNAQEQTDSDMFAQANTQYREGHYERALKLYQQIEPKSAQVNYNLGNCAYKMGKYGHALAYWRRAEIDWGFFGRDELLKNIELVKQSKVTGEQNHDIMHTLVNYGKSLKTQFLSLVKALPLLTLQLFVLIFWIILFAYLRYLYKQKHKIVIAALFLLLALSGTMLAIKYSLMGKLYLVTITQKTDLLSGPGANFMVLAQLPEAQELDMLKESGDFYKVRVNSQIGWIQKTSAETI